MPHRGDGSGARAGAFSSSSASVPPPRKGKDPQVAAGLVAVAAAAAVVVVVVVAVVRLALLLLRWSVSLLLTHMLSLDVVRLALLLLRWSVSLLLTHMLSLDVVNRVTDLGGHLLPHRNVPGQWQQVGACGAVSVGGASSSVEVPFFLTHAGCLDERTARLLFAARRACIFWG